MTRWVRPYRDARQLFLASALFVGSPVVIVLCIVLAASTTRIEPLGAAVVATLASVWIAAAGRLALLGFWVGDQGVRVRTYVRTRTYRWSDIRAFISEPWAQGEQLIIWMHDGTYHLTYVQGHKASLRDVFRRYEYYIARLDRPEYDRLLGYLEKRRASPGLPLPLPR